MILKERSVLLCKAMSDSDDDTDLYKEDLQRNGFSVFTIPAVDVEYKMIVKNALNASDNYSGIIFTSPRSVIGFKHAINSDLTWFNAALQIYVVGHGTSQLVEKNFNLKTTGKESGNASVLADLIIADNQKTLFKKPLLFPCGNLKMDTLPNKLEEVNISLMPLEVYETIPSIHFEERVSKFTNFGAECSEFIVFFSPSGVKYSKPIFDKLKIDMPKVKFVAIGSTTEKMMINFNINVACTAVKPTPESLSEAIKSVSK